VPPAQQIGPTGQLVETPEPERCQDFADFVGDELQIADQHLGGAAVIGAQIVALGCDAHRTRVRMTLPCHDASDRHERGGAESELVGAERRGHGDVASGLDPAVGLQHHPRAQPGAGQGAVRFRQADLPRHARMLDRRARRGAVPPSWPLIWIAPATPAPNARSVFAIAPVTTSG